MGIFFYQHYQNICYKVDFYRKLALFHQLWIAKFSHILDKLSCGDTHALNQYYNSMFIFSVMGVYKNSVASSGGGGGCCCVLFFFFLLQCTNFTEKYYDPQAVNLHSHQTQSLFPPRYCLTLPINSARVIFNNHHSDFAVKLNRQRWDTSPEVPSRTIFLDLF